jgi:hypothetical protein
VPAGEHAPGLRFRLVKVNGNDRVDRFSAAGVILAHADPAPPTAIDDAVGKSPLALSRGRIGGERLRRLAGRGLTVKPAVAEIREIRDAIEDGPGAAAVLVHARARVVRFWRDLRGVAADPIGAHEDDAPLLLRSSFRPMDFPAVELRLREGNGLRHNKIGSNRRFPGAVGRGFRHVHFSNFEARMLPRFQGPGQEAVFVKIFRWARLTNEATSSRASVRKSGFKPALARQTRT